MRCTGGAQVVASWSPGGDQFVSRWIVAQAIFVRTACCFGALSKVFMSVLVLQGQPWCNQVGTVRAVAEGHFGSSHSLKRRVVSTLSKVVWQVLLLPGQPCNATQGIVFSRDPIRVVRLRNGGLLARTVHRGGITGGVQFPTVGSPRNQCRFNAGGTEVSSNRRKSPDEVAAVARSRVELLENAIVVQPKRSEELPERVEQGTSSRSGASSGSPNRGVPVFH